VCCVVSSGVPSCELGVNKLNEWRLDSQFPWSISHFSTDQENL
jgi:hypothetical protein